MRKTALFTLGALALAGCDFAGGSDAVAPISSLTAQNLPAEAGSSADLFFEVQDANGRSFYRSAVQLDTDASELTAVVPAGFAIPSSTSPMYIAIFDFQNTLLDSRLVVRSAGFTAADLTAAPLVLEDAPFRSVGNTEATFTVTRSGAAQ